MSDEVFKLLVWKGETGAYLCAHPWLDVISQGRTPEEAKSSFLHTLAFTTMFCVDAEGVARFPLAPPNVAAKWARLAAEQASKDDG